MAKTPIDRGSIDHKRSVLKDQLRYLNETYSDVAFQALGEPENKALLAKRDDLKAQCDALRADLENLTAAALGADRNADAAKVVDNDKEIDELASQIVAGTDEMDNLLPTIVEHIEGAASPMVRFVNLGAKRQQALYALQRLAGKKFGSRLDRVDGYGALIDGLIGAICRAGIGQTGPSLAPHVIVSPPTRVPTLADAQRTSEGDRARVLELIAECKAPAQPVTLDQE